MSVNSRQPSEVDVIAVIKSIDTTFQSADSSAAEEKSLQKQFASYANEFKSDVAFTPTCKKYSEWDVFSYNYFVWTLAFFIGIQFTHMDQGIMQEFVLDWNVMKHWPPILWVVFFALLTFLGAYFKALISLYDAISYTRYYVIW
eukprot:CAMPEP_0170487244 /NCGR_PEP_ID=MMETSP0208-20121228/6104_1 /TAXON_ID=197538 /ORGANISM="Strombidium inclinatum, Strain S3" /LENGTH=143 /DNA_ID=CAMNT_0010761467 /DNA_START=97 /DNA_END=525 /DNA_ORIENTATION=-